jgi:hypothetical protein
MALSTEDQRVLQEIVDKEGNCLDSKRCIRCPFRAKCLPEFLDPNPPSQPQRLRMAMGVLTHHLLIEEDSVDGVEQDYEWKEK